MRELEPLEYLAYFADGAITAGVAAEGLALFGVDERGLDKVDRAILSNLCGQFDGGPVGIESLAAALSEERGTVEDVLEPYLIQQGFLARTARGRIATSRAYRHLGLKTPQGTPGGLFDPDD